MDTVLITALVNLGFGGVIVLLILFDLLVPGSAYKRLLKENENLKAALALERQRADDVSQAGSVTNQLIGGLIQLATDHRVAEANEHRNAAAVATARYLDPAQKDP